MSWAPGFRRPSAGLVLGAALLLGLTACGPEPTPLPVLPVATSLMPEATAAANELPSLTIDALTLRLLPTAARDRLNAATNIQSVAAVADAGTGPFLSVEPFDGGALTAYGLNVAAHVNANVTPLNDPALVAALTAFLTNRQPDPLRLALANAGYPDGVTLTLAADPSLLPLLLTGLDGGPIHWERVADGTTASVRLAAGAEADALIGQGGLVIGALPLYARGWQVGRGDDGLPLFTVAPAG